MSAPLGARGAGRCALVWRVVACALTALALAGSCREREVGEPRAPALVFVHGLGGGPADWLDVANALGADHRVVLVGLPGHAHRTMADTLPLAQAAAELARQVRAIERPVVLIGHSAGGAVAVRAALLEPARISGLVLVESALRPQMPPAARAGVTSAFARDFTGSVREIYGGFARDDEQASDLARQAGAVGPGAFGRWLPDVVSEDLSARAAALRMPVLVVLAERSWPRGEPWAATAESLGYARVLRLSAVRIPNAGHFLMLDQPAALEAVIREWLGAQRTTASRRTERWSPAVARTK